MRIFILSKRQYTGKDLLNDCYGRLYEIPACLAELGHQIKGITLSYRPRKQGYYHCEDTPNMEWSSINLLPFGLRLYLVTVNRIIKEFKPDIIWACSDAFHAILGHYISIYFKIPLVVDLYDNFESFGATQMPGITHLYRRSCRFADGLSLVSHSLEKFVTSTYGIKGKHIVIGNGVNKTIFYPRDKAEARQSLGLPVTVGLIGTAGSITTGRGIEDLFEAFIELATSDNNLWLAYAGPRDSTPESYVHPRTIDLGNLPLDKMPLIFSALDVAVICNKDSDFGRYCFPQKLFEMLACNTPIVVANIGDIGKILAKYPESLYTPGNKSMLAEQINRQLLNPTLIAELHIPSWLDWSRKLEAFFLQIINV